MRNEKGPPVPAENMVDAICQERHGLRLEVIQMESAMHRAVLVFVTIFGLFAGIYWDTRVIPDRSTRAILLGGVTQIEFFLALFILSLYLNLSVHVGYIRALEKKINQLCGTTITAWDSQITRDFLGHPRGAFFWLQGLLFFTLSFFFVGALLLVSYQIGSPWVITVAIVETAVVFLVAILGLREVGRVSRLASKALGITTTGKASTSSPDRGEKHSAIGLLIGTLIASFIVLSAREGNRGAEDAEHP
jgi:hypothetical protein